LQAEIALHLLHRKPEQVEAALAAISRTSKAGLDELRAALAVASRDDDRAPRAAPQRSGVPPSRRSWLPRWPR
jgi:Histidine kinase